MSGTEAVRELVHKLATTEAVDKVGKPIASKVAGLLAGGAAGGAIGGMVGGVGALSMEEFDLKYQHVLRDGKAMVAVAVEDDEAAEDARQALEKENPEDIHMIDGQGQRIGE